MAEREPIRPKQKRRLIGKIGIVLYALLMTFLQSHYITAQLYRELEYFFGVWLSVSDAEVLSGLLHALCANIGLLLSPVHVAPQAGPCALLMLVSLAVGADRRHNPSRAYLQNLCLLPFLAEGTGSESAAG